MEQASVWCSLKSLFYSITSHIHILSEKYQASKKIETVIVTDNRLQIKKKSVVFGNEVRIITIYIRYWVLFLLESK